MSKELMRVEEKVRGKTKKGLGKEKGRETDEEVARPRPNQTGILIPLRFHSLN